MFEYQMVMIRNNELLAEAAQDRLVREVQRANKNRRAGEARRSGARGSVRRALHLAAR
ncbi:hypothetical protein [Streptacidiphilus rugosus]|uniref:hypothetical protein n=1 Tax=Streptacidiphilus rugosus TaxID=405783 RepID=UPI000AE899B4|nr:hypothetical protein [Streptacidiphilus rugosus]